MEELSYLAYICPRGTREGMNYFVVVEKLKLWSTLIHMCPYRVDNQLEPRTLFASIVSFDLPSAPQSEEI